MRPIDLCFAGAAEQARMVSSGEVSATEVIEATLDRIDAVDRELNAYRVVFDERARVDAAAADAAVPRGEVGPLLGVPVAIKDDVDVEGVVTAWGTDANDHAAEADSPLVSALRRAGAIIIGKTNCSDLTVWPFTETPAWGATRNPWDTGFSPGGSSGGSGAAVAAGLCGLAVGSDGLGSIRVPASFTGVFGLKPQHGRVWHTNQDWYGMAVNGPLSRSVADAALFLDATSTEGDAVGFVDSMRGASRRLRVGVAWRSAAFFPLAARIGAEQRTAVTETAELLTSLGHTLVEREVRFPRATANNYLVRYLKGVAESLPLMDRPDDVPARTRQMARMGRRIPDSILRRALAAEAGIAEQVNRVFDDVDVVLTPGPVQPPLRIGELDGRGAARTLYASGRKIPHFAPWNCIGQPAASVPAGFGSNGLPLSVQLAGRPHDEATLLALAAEIEAARPWASARPSI